MSNVIYLVTSLSASFSSLESKLPFRSVADFDANAREQLSDSQYKKLIGCDIRNFTNWTGKGALKAFVNNMLSLKTDINNIRKANAERSTPALSELPASIIALNPLQREIAIMNWQWRKLSDIEFNQHFTLTQVMVFRLKLQLMLRFNAFNAEKGAQLLADIVHPTKNKEQK